MSIMSLIIGTKFDDGDQDHHYSTSIVHYTLAYIDILCGPPLGGRVTRYTVRLSVSCLVLKVKRKGNVDLFIQRLYSVLLLSQ